MTPSLLILKKVMGRFNVHDLGSHEEDLELLTALRAAQTPDDVLSIKRGLSKPIKEWKLEALNRAMKRVCVSE